MPGFEPTTPDGTNMNVATSALIKQLRRGNELEALYWAKQLEDRYYKYLWRRLIIFASEDVNIGNPHAVVQVRTLADNYMLVKSESKNPVVDRSILTMAVMVLARSEKSRECDDLLNVIDHLTGQFGWRPPLRDETFDLHTQEGKKRWPRHLRLRHWLESASNEENRTGPRDWHLWLLKWAAQRGIYSVDWVAEAARYWDEKGLLNYGAEGHGSAQFGWENVTPEFPGIEPAVPRIDIETHFMSARPWVWHCSSCNRQKTSCSPAERCCEECDHDHALPA